MSIKRFISAGALALTLSVSFVQVGGNQSGGFSPSPIGFKPVKIGPVCLHASGVCTPFPPRV